ncbi:tetratricopeptide repeat protein [Magnetospirillum sp. SS-4]|uniref:tetratricopeptide repeat protein n=1 Tax=Magnetospirillum sp. SS-4 TaxID=2681465 RepID=UPI00138537EE|nr:tetratricopeptide repeat protein [Magnetospirillum sp. SS-4]CAA7621223.1 putative TPR repeat-containing protein [Magnetospirillum sp. SS-4]
MSQDLIDRALAFHRAGQLGKAEPLYREVLSCDPGNAAALHLMGVMALQTGHPDHAVEWIGRALAARPDFPEAHNNLGNALKAMNRTEAAATSFRRALELRPDMAEAHNNLGICLLGLDRAGDACTAFETAIGLRPDYPEATAGRAQALERLGRWADAAAAWNAAIALVPGVGDFRNSLGNCLRRLGRLNDAAEAYGEAVRLRPDFVEFHVNHGVALTDCRRLGEAESRLRAALALVPDHVRATIALGIVLGLGDRLDDAAETLRRAVDLAPDFPPAHVNLGLILLRTGELDEAVRCQHAALRLQPEYALAHNGLAMALAARQSPDQALDSVATALRLRPDLAEAHLTRANILKMLGRKEECAAALKEAARLNPASAEIHTALGRVLFEQWLLDDAVAAHRQALELWPDFPAAQLNLGNALQALDRQQDAALLYEAVISRHPDHALAFGNLLNNIMYRDDLDAEAVGEAHRRYGRAMARPRPDSSDPAGTASDSGKIRIGYLSSDLRNHPVGTNLLPLIRNHDRSAFEIHFYAHVSKTDAHTDEFRALADGWHDITALTDAAAAARIRADGIDILVSLAGRFDQNRPQICAFRPAPIQISMHDVATSGLEEMDYIVGDGRLLARPSAEYFSERRLRLPSFYVAGPPPGASPVPAVPRHGPPVFCSFNNPIKISPTIARAWGAILAALPDSRLVLKFHEAYGSPTLRERLSERLIAAGARPGQIEMVGTKEPYEAFIARYHHVDVALDTAPFSGSTTSFQALSMGVPVLTMPQDRMVSRWTASMLRTVRLPGLIADGPEDYVAKAIALARSVDDWRGRRAELSQRTLASSLCDGPGWTRRLERLYRAVWQRHRRGRR